MFIGDLDSLRMVLLYLQKVDSDIYLTFMLHAIGYDESCVTYFTHRQRRKLTPRASGLLVLPLAEVNSFPQVPEEHEILDAAHRSHAQIAVKEGQLVEAAILPLLHEKLKAL